MSFSCGFVGLPNVGKSTLFNALCKGGAQAANYPFCTIDPNTGIVNVPDPRLDVLAKMEKSKRVIPSTLKFIDIAGLVKGASKGEGLGNQFLSNIRTVDAIAHVVRMFQDPDVVHVDGKFDPISDMETILTELMLSDMDMVAKMKEKAHKQARSQDADLKMQYDILADLDAQLSEGKIPTYDKEDSRVADFVKSLGLLTIMPAFICANTDEATFQNFDKDEKACKLREYAATKGMEVVPVCAKFEDELQKLDPEEAKMFMDDLGISEPGLNRVIRTSYKLLNYCDFFTTGPDETRAWTIVKGTAAPQAAGKIHTDMCRGFIRMEVVSYDDLVTLGGWNQAREAGKLRTEGKEYIVKDGDVVYVLFNV